VADKTLAELQAFNAAAKFKDGKYERQVVPTLADVVGLLKNSTVRVEVEIKAPPQGRYASIEEKLVKEIADRNLFAQVQVLKGLMSKKVGSKKGSSGFAVASPMLKADGHIRQPARDV
jgi:glycerophosphoryl diester phosphodiesterase